MSTLIKVLNSSGPFTGTVRQSWLGGRARDLRASLLRAKPLQWASMTGLLAAAALCGYPSLAGEWQRVFVVASIFPFLVSLEWRGAEPVRISRSALAIFVVLVGLAPVRGFAGDLSKYRSFQLGTDIPTVTRLSATTPAQVKVIHRRPALIQELEWRPQPLGPSSMAEQVKEVLFGFYDGRLFRISVTYDRYETEGLTADDFIDAISSTYGVAERFGTPASAATGAYGDEEQILARWQDSNYSFQLIRAAYGPTYRLLGTVKNMEALAEAAMLEGKRIDASEEPQRNADREAAEKQAETLKLQKARLANKPKFRP